MYLLEPMYEKYSLETMNQVASKAMISLGQDNFTDVIYNLSASDDVCIRIYDGNTDIMAGNYGSPLYQMKYDEINQLFKLTKENNNEFVQKTVLKQEAGQADITKSILLSRIGENDGKPALIMVYTRLSPMNATLQTLRVQLFYIGIMLIVAMLILTYVMNKHIAIPLININEEAKDISDGEYDIDEKTNQYLEAQELNETLLQASNDIQKAEQAKRDLIANVSHDLRTPLTMIKGYGEMMLDLPDEKTDENIQVIIDEAQRLSYLVNDLLDLSKLQENKIELDLVTFDLSSMILEQLKKYNVYEVQDGFEINQTIEPNLMVQGDLKRLEQVFNNFMSNAINYCGTHKKVDVHVYKHNDHVRVEVKDYGIGIPKDKQKDIWDRYYKLDKTHVRALNSSGIGLAIAKEILELHKAVYGVESEENEGSVFYFGLPLIIEDQGI